ncbi:type I glyceraldehyde-3-phosphate dehydrogenase [Candidatus Peregrinibacteria bacterium]|jgi:glyceraldehyde 3-phosphate dehydrogenase|nr:type I glyceraldehyde-3-phosphate dehydrogenase [Candidatus Peregrinibacteria bacterium]MBT7702673.1 type I glyceraldehyde-3-phosphate dehydrogenase [Candidatus Peregrinibacteria bacterium]
MKPRVAINGFGRIGRNVFRANLEKQTCDIVAINDLGDLETLAHLLEYDSMYGILDAKIEVTSDKLIVNGQEIRVLSERDPEKLPWAEENIDVVVESTGFFRTREGASKHLQAGAKKVVVSAPGKDLDLMVVLGVNDADYDPANHHLISNASCTTNCLAPVAKVLHEEFGIEHGLMTTTHAYTNDQRILDLPHKDLRRARAAALSMIPTTTGAAKAVAMVLPELDGKLNGMSLRVPTPTVSVVDLVVTLNKSATAESVNAALKAAAEGPLQGILAYSEKPLVSIDYKGNPHSSIVDSLATMSIGDNMVKILAWYDNEWGYSCRMVDLVGRL